MGTLIATSPAFSFDPKQKPKTIICSLESPIKIKASALSLTVVD
jgi:hypothetical protein